MSWTIRNLAVVLAVVAFVSPVHPAEGDRPSQSKQPAKEKKSPEFKSSAKQSSPNSDPKNRSKEPPKQGDADDRAVQPSPPPSTNPFHKLDVNPNPKKATPQRSLVQDGLGRYQLDWQVLAATRVEEDLKPRFPSNLRKADGKKVTVHGLMRPLDEQIAVAQVFLMVEYRADCLNCQISDPTGLVLVELKPERQTPVTYGELVVQGKLHLNDDDPDDFLFILTDSEIISRK